MNLIDFGTKAFTDVADFKEPFDANNESMAFEFLTGALSSQLNSTQSIDTYQERLKGLEPIDNIDKFNLMNVIRLQIDEKDILSKNMDYLSANRMANLQKIFK